MSTWHRPTMWSHRATEWEFTRVTQGTNSRVNLILPGFTFPRFFVSQLYGYCLGLFDLKTIRGLVYIKRVFNWGPEDLVKRGTILTQWGELWDTVLKFSCSTCNNSLEFLWKEREQAAPLPQYFFILFCRCVIRSGRCQRTTSTLLTLLFLSL